MAKTVYGLISDTHQQPQIVPVAIQILKKLGAQKLILNGDLGESQRAIGLTLQNAVMSGLETYAQPGSHETVQNYEPVLKFFTSRYQNVISAFDHPKIEANSHHLVFLPGSDWRPSTAAHNGYALGLFENAPQGLVQISEGIMRFTDIGSLDRLVTDPDKTIVVCHVPRKFDNVVTCVDYAYFAEKSDGSLLPGVVLESIIKNRAGSQITQEEINKIAVANGVTFIKENRGNADLRKAYERLGIRKAVSGHFHEASHRANDRKNNPVPEDTFVDELFWNSGYLDGGHCGILEVDDNKVSYHNIKLIEHVS